MNKPFSIIYEEFKQDLANLINNSNLPISVIELILRDYLMEVSNIAKSQYQSDKTQYENFLKKENNEEIKNAG